MQKKNSYMIDYTKKAMKNRLQSFDTMHTRRVMHSTQKDLRDVRESIRVSISPDSGEFLPNT